MVSIARPVFDTGPKDSIAVVDIYGAVSSDIRNNLTSKISSFGNALTDSFSAVNQIFNKLGSKLSQGEIDVAAAATRIKNALGGSRSDIVGLAKELQNSVYSELTGIIPGTDYVRGATDLFDQVKVIAGNAQHIVYQDRQTVSSILNFVSDLSGNQIFKTLDLGAEAALIGGLIGKVSSWGVPELVDSMLADRDDDFRYSVYSRNSSSILQSSNAVMIEHYINNGMTSALTNHVPTFADDFLAKYSFPAGTTPDQYPVLHAQLIKIMNALKPTWLFTQRGTITTVSGNQTVVAPRLVVNLAILSRASADAVKLLKSDISTRTHVMAAKNFPKQNVNAIAKKFYPLVGIV